jgi:hypothetical protein
MKEKRYNHAMDIAFAVPNSKYEDWYDCLRYEKQAVINALQKRVREVFEANEYAEAISGHDTYEEGDLPPITNPDLMDVAEIEKQIGLIIGPEGTTK